MTGRQLGRRRVSSAVVHAAVEVVSTGLGDAGSGDILVALVDGVLHLFQELINVE